jgi:flagellar motility protein MotE (MotC chaperone)
MTIQEQENRWSTPEEIAQAIIDQARDFDTDTEQEAEELANITAELKELEAKGSSLYYALRFITSK